MNPTVWLFLIDKSELSETVKVSKITSNNIFHTFPACENFFSINEGLTCQEIILDFKKLQKRIK